MRTRSVAKLGRARAATNCLAAVDQAPGTHLGVVCGDRPLERRSSEGNLLRGIAVEDQVGYPRVAHVLTEDLHVLPSMHMSC